MEQNAEFLQQEYGKGGKGMVLGGRNVSVFWDADGIRIAYGRASRYERAQTVSWFQAAKRIREMLDAGLYMQNGGLDMVDYNERRELAGQLWNFYRDTLGLSDEWNLKGGYPEEVQKIMEQLEDPVQSEQIAVRFFADVETVALGENPRYVWRNMNRLKDNMTAFLRPKLTFTATEPVQPPEKRFITQDEIDLEFADGGRVAGSRDRIFRYYQESHTLNERISFLKNEYGIGGHSHAMGGADNAWEDHDGKGIKLTRGGLANPYDQVLLKWDKVAKRIGELIAAGRYLTPDEYRMLHPEEDEPVEAPAKEYELGFGSLGNGTTVWNRLEEEHGDYKTVEWAHLFANPDYSNIVDMYEGGYFHTRGIFRSEATSCMNNNIPYYSAISRQEMVERIKRYAGEEFSLAEFYAKDVRDASNNDFVTRSLEVEDNATTRAAAAKQMAPKFMGDKPQLKK